MSRAAVQRVRYMEGHGADYTFACPRCGWRTCDMLALITHKDKCGTPPSPRRTRRGTKRGHA